MRVYPIKEYNIYVDAFLLLVIHLDSIKTLTLDALLPGVEPVRRDVTARHPGRPDAGPVAAVAVVELVVGPQAAADAAAAAQARNYNLAPVLPMYNNAQGFLKNFLKI